MNYKKIFGVSALSMCLALGVVSCSSDVTEDSQATTETTQNAPTVEQTQKMLNSSIGSLGATFGDTGFQNTLRAKNIIAQIPCAKTSTDVEKLKDLLLFWFNFTGDEADIVAYLNLCSIHGEYTFDGSNWKIVNLFLPDELKINYTNDGKTYCIDVKYKKSIYVSGPDLVKDVTIFGKTFSTKTYVKMPNEIEMTVSEDAEALATVEANIALPGSAENDGKYYFDPAEDTAYITAGIKSENYSIIDASIVSAKSIASVISISKGDKEIMQLTATTKPKTSATGKTATATVKVVTYATETAPEMTFEASVNDTKELVNNLILIYNGTAEDPEAVVSAINENLNGGIKVTANQDGQDVVLATITFELQTNGDGTYRIKPVVTINDEVISDFFGADINISDILKQIIDMIKGSIGGSEE